MATHCTECGLPMSEDAGFCVNCGEAAKQAPPSPPAQPAAPPPRKSLLHLVAISLAIFAALGALGVIGAVYVVHRVTRSIATAVRNHGVDVSVLTGPLRHRTRTRTPCSLLRKEEAERILGVSIDRTVDQGHTCAYCSSPAPGDRECDPYLTVDFIERGKAQIALKLARDALGAGARAPARLSRIGDDAVLDPLNSRLVFTRNGLGVRIELHQPSGRGSSGLAVALAERISSRL